MALPFPHGSGPGQIANGNNFDPNDTPGLPGGRFIGFGENASSAITNRAAWALSTNIDYIYQNYTAYKAIPAAFDFTAGTGGVSSITITDYVFAGDDTYPSVLVDGMMFLFAVLDGQYNALTDEAGNEVRVSDITKAGLSIYGSGTFQADVNLPFCTVNPITGAVVAPSYTIPEGTVVRVMYPSRSSLEKLPIDVFTRFKVMSSEEVPAGVLLLDGSLPMAGDLRLGSHNLLACASISNEDYGVQVEDTLYGGSTYGLVGFVGIDNNGHGTVHATDGFDGGSTGPLENFSTVTVRPIDGALPVVSIFGGSTDTELDIEINYDPLGATAGQAVWDFYDPVASASFTLTLDAAHNSYAPTSGPIDLGAAANPWGTVYAGALSLKTDLVYITSAGNVGPTQAPLFSEDDYWLKEDFSGHGIYTQGSDMGSGLWIESTATAVLQHGTDLSYNRATFMDMGTTTAVGSYLNIGGPTLLDLQGDFVRASTGLAIAVASDPVGEAYTLKFGFNVTADPATTPCAYLELDASGTLRFYYSNVATSNSVNLGGITTQRWYDMKLVFGTGTITVYIDGLFVTSANLVLPVGNYAFTGLRIDKTGGSAGSHALIDYTQLYSQGHKARPHT